MDNIDRKDKLDIVPQNGHVLCKRIVDETEDADLGGIFCSKTNVPVYEVIKISNPPTLAEISDELKLKVGDRIVCNSTGTQVQNGEDEVLWLFK